jgi:uncharacterized protein YfiM (DUF2279 family)
MRAAVLCVVALAALCSAVAAEEWSLRPDKVLHFTVGVAVSSLNPIMRSSGTDHDSVLAPMVTSVALAMGKEYIDPQWSWADIAYTVAGTAAGVMVWRQFNVLIIGDRLIIAGRF